MQLHTVTWRLMVDFLYENGRDGKRGEWCIETMGRGKEQSGCYNFDIVLIEMLAFWNQLLWLESKKGFLHVLQKQTFT